MKQLTNPHRTALSAIAAVLVLGSTPAAAQQAGDASAATPDIIVPSAQPAPTPALPVTNSGIAPITVAPPVVQSSVPQASVAPSSSNISQAPILSPSAAPAEPAREASEPAPTSRSTVAADVSERSTPPVEASPADTRAPAADTSADAAQPPQIAPMAGIAPSELMAMEQGEAAAPAQPVTQTAPVAAANDSNVWAIVGGAGALLLLGGAAYAFRRRRQVDAEVAIAQERAPVAAEPVPTTVVTRDGIMPIATVEPATASRETMVEPRPAYAATMQSSGSQAGASADPARHDLESMAAAAPTAENPFLTRRNRLRRAHFLMAHEHARPQQAATDQQRRKDISVTQSQSQRSFQQVYDFGQKPVSFRPATRKPATS